MKRLRIAASLVAATLLGGACGSTVQHSGTSIAGGDETLGTSAPSAELSAPGAGASVAPAPIAPRPAQGAPNNSTANQTAGASAANPGQGAAAATNPGGGTNPAVAAQPAGQPGGAPTSAGQPGETPTSTGQPGSAPTSSAVRGVTEDAITVAFLYSDDQDQTAAAFGLGESDLGGWREFFEAMVAWVNANGGVNGRELAPYYRPFTTAEYTSATFSADVCAELTQDQNVYAAIGEANEDLVACLSPAGVPMFDTAPVSGLDAEAFGQYQGFVYHTSGLDLTQNAVLTAQAHVATGYVTPESTVGVITIDQPSYARAAEVFEAELANHGVPVAETVLITYPGEDFGSSQIANTVLRFRSQGVDRVAVLEINGLMWWEFTLAAEAQAYRPKYMLNPTSYAQFWANSGQMPTPQMEGSRGVATHVMLHIQGDSEPYPPPGRAPCREILDAAGMPAGSEDAEATQLHACEGVRFIKWALDRAADLSPAGLQAAVESIGRTFEPALSFGTYHGPGFHTGAGLYVDYEYGADCTCFRATSGPANVPGTPS